MVSVGEPPTPPPPKLFYHISKKIPQVCMINYNMFLPSTEDSTTGIAPSTEDNTPHGMCYLLSIPHTWKNTTFLKRVLFTENGAIH